MADIGGQAGGFNAPYTPIRETRIAQDSAIRHVAPKPDPATQADTQVQSLDIQQDEVVNLVLQRRLDAQEIHRKVGADRAKQADSFTRSGEETGAARANSAAELLGQVTDPARKEQLQKEKLQNLNTAQIGDKSVVKLDIAKDQNLAAQVLQSQEDIDPDAKARKDLDSKLAKIKKGGGSKGNDFVSFVERQKNEKGLVSDSINELVNGFLSTIRGKGLTPAEMVVEGVDRQSLVATMLDPDNAEETSALRTSLASAIATPADKRAELFAIRNLTKNMDRIAPPKRENDAHKLSKHEQAIKFIASISLGAVTAPWDTASKFALA